VGSSQGEARTPATEDTESQGFPKVFGKYVLVRPMARGGMGELFLAAAGETGGFEKMCVVKKVLRSVEDQGVHRRFLDEAKVVVRLNHANLVQVFDAGRVDEEYYLAMELVEGKDLRAVWNRCAQLHRRIPVEVAIFVVREILRGLEYAHDALALDLVHRDISPPNLLLGYRGEVKLTDFGLAKSAIKREMTSPGVVFGRYSYLAPEQAKGLPADRRTDIYACGIVLWELLTGRQLFPSAGRSHQQALAAVRNPKVRAPSSLVPGIPEGLDAVVLRSLAKDPKDRHQAAGELRTELSNVLSRHFPGCDADRAGEFMRDIFAREYKLEGRSVAELSQRDFSGLRAEAQHTSTISLGEALAAEDGNAEVALRDSEIIELEKARRGFGTSSQNLRDEAKAWVGKIVAQRYRVEGIIGIGGMGAVFRARHLALGKTFALKILHRVYTRDADIVARFMREARAATQTGHPNIIDIIDIGTTDAEDVYFVMELLEGRTLGEVVGTEGPLAVRRAVNIARQICRAVAAAHEVGIIHRDLKSDNVILVSRGKDPDFVKVLDFGICKTNSSDSGTTSPGVVMGSPDYMAPEQGAGLEATVASDVYAVGCIVYEMLAGRLPFKGRNAIDVLMQKGAREAERVTTHRPEVPPPLAEVLARCLMRSPQDRPPSMRALEYELTRAVDGRATAVAAVLGLNMEGDSGPQMTGDGDPSPAASASFHRAAIAALQTRPAGYEPSERTVVAARPQQEHTQIAPAPLIPPYNAGGVITAAQVRASSYVPLPTARAEPDPKGGSGMASGLKALAFVVLGGLLASGLLLALSPETFKSLLPGDTGQAPADQRGMPEGKTDAGKADAGKADAGKADAGKADAGKADAGKAVQGATLDVPEPADGGGVDPTAGAGGAEPLVVDDAGGSVDVVPDEPRPSGPVTVQELVTQAEVALAKNHWREPAEQSMALALANLALVDPGHEALRRLRQVAADELLPLGDKALARKRWSEASAMYRDLVAVWPDHEVARQQLLEALRNEGRVLAKHDDPARTLAVADEILTMDPQDFRAMMLQADSLYALRRYEEAKLAFGRAKRANPRSKAAKKGWWRAHAKAGKANG
jgi:eukaryotic-like serine/threonine-protein kinase